jgi:hypothetical protein
MTNCAVATLPNRNNSGATVTASVGAGMSPRDATTRAGAINFTPLSLSLARCLGLDHDRPHSTRRADCIRTLKNKQVPRFAPFKV